ncbi:MULTISPECIES: hypothetical protein [Bradyrhizobium]|nr:MULTISPECIES: hypothetical protein [Bradyrhizobium]MCS3453643.1 hypothetical protein [Bradyrhizobium elkanii]MCS3564250.1 hypothetical protein [Bradyrhizobium elkanii]MCW2145918.1 hypothetical protein [Bradyrhizobium elkanii]MCW2355009.1 hypothetical protein [Bradyrhizobium elkanii]MCW2378745.1 hypothetical protein [Bradyrhizobium elkanii]
MPASTMATSDTPAKKIPLLSFIGFLQYGFVAAMDASRARIATEFHEPAIFCRCVGDENDSNAFASL